MPAPRTRAAVDSFLNSFADDMVPAAALATFAAASDADGTVISAVRLGWGGQSERANELQGTTASSSGWVSCAGAWDKIITIKRRPTKKLLQMTRGRTAKALARRSDNRYLHIHLSRKHEHRKDSTRSKFCRVTIASVGPGYTVPCPICRLHYLWYLPDLEPTHVRA
jgi:hypothetical protein